MARKKTEDKRKRRKREEEEEDDKLISPETQKGIAIVVLFAAALISILSMAGMAGTGGEWLSKSFKAFFGWGGFLFPLVLLILGYCLIYPDRYRIKITNWIGLVLFFLSAYGFLNIVGDAGGYLGVVLSYPLQQLLGFWGALILIIALVVVSLLLLFNLSIQRLFSGRDIASDWFWKIKMLWLKLFSKNDEEPESPDEGEDEEDIEFNDREIKEGDEDEDPEQLELIEKPKKRPSRKIKLPTNLLDNKKDKPHGGNIDLNKEKIQHTLDNFGIDVEMGDVEVGPTVTQYTLKPAEGIKLSKIITLNNDLSLALAAHPLRIEAPIPGKSLVGIEVPNKTKAVIGLREILESNDFKSSDADLKLGMGVDVTGTSYLVDLAKMPHMLIAGATGSGKSVCINSIIVNLLYQYGPDDLKIILVDPKRVEFSLYNDIPHLLTPVITQVDKTINALKWVVAEMDRRYELLSQAGKRDIKSYNNSNPDQNMPYLVLVIDELADLMSTAARDVEAAIVRLAQMARAVGIHLILATQRPSVDVITGLIKANITSRVAFNVASITDSRTILDGAGAEKLLGKGDMLYVSAELSKPKRLQGALLHEKEIQRIVKYLKDQAKPEYDEEVTERQASHSSHGGNSAGTSDEEEDELLSEAKEVILNAGKASASLLQRRLRIGYARAARILDILEEHGFIGPADGAKPRELLAQSEGVETEEGFEEDEEEHDQV